MLERTNETYGIKLNASPKESLSSLPIYLLAGRKLYEVEFEGVVFLAVSIALLPSGALRNSYTSFTLNAHMRVRAFRVSTHMC